MDTGRYCEAAIARGETIEDVDQMYTLRVNNVWMANEVEIRKEFELYGRLGDVYRPINKDKLKPADFFFVRFMEYDDMVKNKYFINYKMHKVKCILYVISTYIQVAALKDLQGKYLHGRKMIIQETYSPFELQTSVF